MRSRPQRLTALAAVAALAAVVATGCGREDPDMANGKQLFVERCGSCHTLARACTTGVTGPNLDELGGLDILMEPSRFVRELPEALFEKWVIGS